MSRNPSFPVAILAGGLATRLRPVTEIMPKSLIKFNGEPFILHQLRLLRKKGIEQVVLCVGFLGEQIQSLVGDGASEGISVCYSYDFSEKKNLLGTAGALKKALPCLGKQFFVLYGDSYLPCNYQAVQMAFLTQKRHSLMTIFHNQGLWDKSNIHYANHEIIVYDKKSQSADLAYIDYGLGVFEASAFNDVPDNTPYDLADLYQLLLKKKQLGAFEVKERFYEVGSFSGIEETQNFFKSIRLHNEF